jgi:hypothetical protein
MTESDRVWTGTNDGVTYQFNEDTGRLTVEAVPEPSTYALFGLGAMALIIAFRRKAA